MKNVQWGLQKSLGFAAGFAVIAIAIYTITGGEAFKRNEVALEAVVATYFGTAMFAGVILGMLRPFTKHWLPATCVGVIVAWPISFGFFLLSGSSLSDFRSEWQVVTGLAVAYGIVGTFILRRIERAESPQSR